MLYRTPALHKIRSETVRSHCNSCKRFYTNFEVGERDGIFSNYAPLVYHKTRGQAFGICSTTVACRSRSTLSPQSIRVIAGMMK